MKKNSGFLIKDINAFLKYINGGRLPLTQAGYLKLKDVEIIGGLFTWPSKAESAIKNKFIKEARSEYEIVYLHFVRILSEVSGLVVREKNKLSQSAEIDRFFILSNSDQLQYLFNSWCLNLNWDYFARTDGNIIEQLQKNLSLFLTFLLSVKSSTFPIKDLVEVVQANLTNVDCKTDTQFNFEINYFLNFLEYFDAIKFKREKNDYGFKEKTGITVTRQGRRLIKETLMIIDALQDSTQSKKELPVDNTHVIPGGMSIERELDQIKTLIDQHNFTSADEVNEFLENLDPDQLPQLVQNELSAKHKAQELIYDAWEIFNSKQRIKLANQALKIYRYCADAYNILAEEAATPKKSIDYYHKALEAGRQALGSAKFEEYKGHFWGELETRPYMRALYGLAQCQWALGERKQAIEKLSEMIELNPSDNQGARYILALYLLTEGENAKLKKLFKWYPNDADGGFNYTHALFLFKKHGPNEKSGKQLRIAINLNSNIPQYLLGHKQLPKELADSAALGSDEEAQWYANDATALWQETPAALKWLAKNILSLVH